jgi:serine/threonine protein kinase
MPETIGHYNVLDRIGSGGIGEVFRARDTRLGRTVALKVVSNEIASNPERRARFLADVRPLMALSHPNIATVYEVAEEAGAVYLVLEFVPGEPLSRLIAGRGLNARRAIEYAIQIADALAEAHAVGIAHHDLTTANVVITPKGTVKLLDFGLASWTQSGRSRGPQDDIFSLGTVIVEMITGRRFDDQASAARPPVVGREVPEEFDPIVSRMLTQEADARYESPATAAAELRTLAERLDQRSESVRQPQPTPARRQPSGALRWLLVVLAILLAAAVAWIALQR